jgi:hypothetical protein
LTSNVYICMELQIYVSLDEFCEVQNNWEGEGVVYKGNVAYMFGSSKSKDAAKMDSLLLVVEAKIRWPADSSAHVLAEAGCLLKRRLAAGKKTPYLLF